MTIAGSVVLIMLGAILTWAVEFGLAALDVGVAGVIPMLGGVAGLLCGVRRIAAARRTRVVTTAPAGTARQVREERRYGAPAGDPRFRRTAPA